MDESAARFALISARSNKYGHILKSVSLIYTLKINLAD